LPKGLPKTFSDVFTSPNKVINSDTYDKATIFTFISQYCFKFLSINSPDVNNDSIADQFAEDVTETRLDWKPEDVVYFFKFIRQRQDIPELNVMGNKITAIKLNSWLPIYDEYRSEEKEHHNKKMFQQNSNESKPANPEGLKRIASILKTIVKPVDAELTKPTEQTEANKQVQEWIKEFDNLRKDNGYKRFVEYDGIFMNIDDFILHKSQQVSN
jgi:hypothetical protein